MNRIVFIVEDEQHCTDRIVEFLKPYQGKIDLYCFDSVERAKKEWEIRNPDIVLLDIRIGDRTGFDLLKEISLTDFCLIFTTSFEQYALDAFRFSALDYLMKPIDREEFEIALNKAFEKLDHQQLTERLGVLLGHLSQVPTNKKISLPFNNGFVFLEIQDVLRCEADSNYTHLFTVEGKKYTVSKTLKYYELLLQDFGFFRIHNSHLINLKFVNEYSKTGYVTLSTKLVLEVSSRRKEAFSKAMGLFLNDRLS